MALDEAQRIKVAKILRITPDLLYLHITSGAFEMTTARQAAIESELRRWDSYSEKFTRIHPNLKNFGAEIDPSQIKDEIRQNLASFFERIEWAADFAPVEFSLSRG